MYFSKEPIPISSIDNDIKHVLELCHSYFDNRADISNETHDDGFPLPNEEMTCLMYLNQHIDFAK